MLQLLPKLKAVYLHTVKGALWGLHGALMGVEV